MEKYKRLTDKRLTSILTSKEMGCFYEPKSKEERAELVELSEQLTYEAIYTRLAELENKIENGTLVELPCKVGDKVYYTSPEYYNSLLVEYTVTEISQTREGLRFSVYGSPKEKGLITYLYADFIGKTVFLTQAEAEKKIKAVQKDD